MARTIGLHITLPDGGSFEREFDADTILIGSGPSAVLRVDHADVSSIHAVIKSTPDGTVSVVDLGSETGTTVNGQAISEAVTLSPGDRLGLGQVEMLIKVSEAKTEKRASVEPSTTKIETPSKERPQVMETNAHSAPNGTHAPFAPITEASDLDESLLRSPLHESSKPTAEHHALQISVLWGTEIIDSAQVREPRDVTIGALKAGQKVDLRVETDLPVTQFTIASNRGSEASIVVPASAKVGLRKSDGSVVRNVQLAATDGPFPAKSYTLGFGERLAFKVGTLTFLAEYVRGDGELGKGSPMDWYFPRVFAISALLHVFFVIAAFVTPHVGMSLSDELFKNQNRFAQMILKAPEKEKERKKLDLSGSKGGAKHKGEEGKFGKKDKPKKDALASKAGAPRVDPNKREKDRKIAMNAGLLGILKGNAGEGAVSNVFGPGGLGTGINNAMGGLRGTEMGDAGGAGGLGTRGAGAGGGGNSLGIGGLGTHGHGRGTGGYGNIDLGGRGKGTTRILPGRTIVQGSLSKEEIGRVIRRNLARFKYCYEKELNANPNLSGKIAVYFQIAPTGSVATAEVRETQMNDANVEGCVVKVMRTLKFPQPRGGGIVVVTYPFVFQPS